MHSVNRGSNKSTGTLILVASERKSTRSSPSTGFPGFSRLHADHLPGSRTNLPGHATLDRKPRKLREFPVALALMYAGSDEDAAHRGATRTHLPIPDPAPCRRSPRRRHGRPCGRASRQAGAAGPGSIDVRARNTAHFRLADPRPAVAEGMMNKRTPEPFPCPFCRSGSVSVIGAARTFLHYRCTTCAEVWTAMRAPSESADMRSARTVSGRSRVLPKITCH